MGWMAPAHGIEVPRGEGCQAFTSIRGAPIMKMGTIGIDLAKSVFQVRGIVLPKEVGRPPIAHGTIQGHRLKLARGVPREPVSLSDDPYRGAS